MAVMLVKPGAEVTVSDLKSLLEAWKTYGGPLTLVSRFIVKKPLTASQLRRLPVALKDLLYCPDDAVRFLERLYSLEDPR